MSRERSWCFTLNNYDEEDEKELLEKAETAAVKYCVVGREVGESGTPHLQGFIVFANAKTPRAARSFLFANRGHWESKRGTFKQASDYAKKDGDIVCECGVLPLDPKQKGDSERERWDLALEACKRGKFEDVPSDILLRHLGNCMRIQRQFGTVSLERLDAVCGQWFYGAPGTGKSYTARDRYPNAYIKMTNKWWDGYQFEEEVIMDEAELKTEVLGHHLKIWADCYPFQAEIKGGSMMIRPKVFVVTSNYSIAEIFNSDPELVKALERRFHVTRFNNLFRRE